MIDIKKIDLLNTLKAWGNGEITTDQMQCWMIDHYEPADIKIGEGETTWCVDAMNIVMNEYELAVQEKIVVDNYMLAIDFINTSEHDYPKTRSLFMQQGFID